MTYEEYVLRLLDAIGARESDVELTTMLPTIIDYAEGRCYRDLDLISTSVRDATSSLSADSRSFTIPTPASGTYVVVEQMNLLENSSRTPLTSVSRDYIDMAWPDDTSDAATDRPVAFAVVSNTSILVGPVSGASVSVEVIGRVKPTPLSSSNTSTYLTTIYPDLFIAASRVAACMYDKTLDAAKAEGEYAMILAKADLQAARQKFAGATWSAKRPEPYAVPQRG